ncbi:hypothetical protein [Mucilaginibacter sp.]
MRKSEDDLQPDLPSFIKSWNQFYGIVAVWLVFLILIFGLITQTLK